MQTIPFRGSKSRNKVSVCEPADGSLSIDPLESEFSDSLSPDTRGRANVGLEVTTARRWYDIVRYAGPELVVCLALEVDTRDK